MSRLYQQSEATAARRRFPVFLVDATDGLTPETGEGSGQPQISKNGGAFANTSNTLTSVGNGYYYVELTASELDTLGDFVVRFKSANTAEFNMDGQVVAFDPYDANLGIDGSGFTAIPWNSSWDAEVQSEVQDAIEANHLDHLLAVDYDPASKPGTATALLNEIVENDGGVSRFTANALEQAPDAGTGTGLTAIPWNSSWDTEVQSEVQDALEANHLDHLLAVDYDPASKPGTATALLNEIIENDGGVSRFTANALEQAPDTDHTGTGTGLTAIPWNSSWDAEVESEANDALVALGLDHLVSASVSGSDITDASIFAKVVSSSATADWDDFVNTSDSLQAIRDRGDAAWTTGGGGSITDILNVIPLIPYSLDLADTATVRLGLMLTNAVDDLPSTAEITPGTISIDRKAIGGTSWTSVVSDAACSESAGLVYYDEVFDSTTGYAEGDTIRVTFKSQKITVSANDYEVTDATGRFFYTEIRQTMRGTDSANTTTPPTAAAIVDEWESQSQADPTGFHVNVREWLDTAVTASSGNPDVNVESIDDIDAPTTWKASINTEVDKALNTAIPGSPTSGSINERVKTLDEDWADGGRLDLIIDAILADTGTDGVAVSSGTINSIADGLLDRADGVEPSSGGTERTVREALRLILSACVGKLSGAATTTVAIRDTNDSKNRISATVDSDGNRSAVTLDDT